MNSNPGDDWRKKYFDSLQLLEGERERSHALEAAFKRLAGRLCIASTGQSAQLDAELKRVQAALRGDSSSDELDKLAAALTDVINALDQSTAAPTQQSATTHQTSVDDVHVRSALAALLAELNRDAELAPQVQALDAKLAAPLPGNALADLLATLTGLVTQRIGRIEKQKQAIELVLSHMAEQLDEVGRFVVDYDRSQSQSQVSSDTLNTQLIGEMTAMGQSVEAAIDLNHIRAQVRNRLDLIGQHLQSFQQREAALATAMRVRTELMQTRVQQLERERKKLHNQLKDEQRLSLIDALTKIPNRLAYEKRIEEELKRSARFNQPACLAVWDVDHFKRINDSYGHRAGDRVLQAAAEWLSSHIRGTDFMARYGGEEFVMLLCGTQPDDAMRLMDEMRIAISNIRFKTRDIAISITVSGGLTALRMEDSAASAFERADKALYGAKEAGRNRCMVG